MAKYRENSATTQLNTQLNSTLNSTHRERVIPSQLLKKIPRSYKRDLLCTVPNKFQIFDRSDLRQERTCEGEGEGEGEGWIRFSSPFYFTTTTTDYM